MSKEKMKYEMRNVDELIPYARNARTHSPEQVTKLASSIKEFGFINPVIISDDGGVLAGHGRIMAAKKLGIEKVPCVIESHLTDAQKKAYILADNRLALDAGWDEEMLKLELNELKDLCFDIELTGFEEKELNQLVSSENEEMKLPDEVDFKQDLEIIISCESPEQQESLFNEFEERGLKCRVLGL
mgnify:CR=1 FL=1